MLAAESRLLINSTRQGRATVHYYTARTAVPVVVM